MKKALAGTAVLALLCLGSLAQASIAIETVPVGNAGNTGELSGVGAGGTGADRVCGAVSYNYSIGKYEVTAGQYTDFLNAKAKTDDYGLYNPQMAYTSHDYYGCNIQRSGSSGNYSYSVASDWANRPVNYVSLWDACRFANWLGNGQGNGDTETGAYTLTADGIVNNTITRNAGWTWAVTSEDEWYKAAYCKGGSTDAGYWDYPSKSDSAPANQVLPTDPGNSANYRIGTAYSIGGPYYRTLVGEFENSASAYGTFDQGGNVWEWNEAIIGGASRGLRGGSLVSYYSSLQASDRDSFVVTNEEGGVGFRLSAVPEPSSLLALGSGLLALVSLIRRRR